MNILFDEIKYLIYIFNDFGFCLINFLYFLSQVRILWNLKLIQDSGAVLEQGWKYLKDIPLVRTD